MPDLANLRDQVPAACVGDLNVSGPEKFKSPTQAAGKWTRKFGKPGKFVLYCTEHEDMTMKLTVKRR